MAFEVTGAGIETLSLTRAFDAVVCRAVLHHVEPLVPVLRAVRDRLKPGGAFLAVDEPTVRRSAHEERALAEHPFVPYGVKERVFTPAHYRFALREAGFVGVRAGFPVAWIDYRSVIHPEGARALTTLRYCAYRLRNQLLHPPGSVRSFVARRPQTQ